MFHGDLAALHGRKRGPMALRGDTCAAGGIHRYLCLRQERLHQQGVGNHADVGAEADQRHLFNEFLFILLRQQTPQLRAAEGGLVQNGLSCAGRPELLDDLPALGPPDAVGYRQVPPLPGMEIVRPMGVPVKKIRSPRRMPAATRSAAAGTIRRASGVPRAPDTKSFCISTTIRMFIMISSFLSS